MERKLVVFTIGWFEVHQPETNLVAKERLEIHPLASSQEPRLWQINPKHFLTRGHILILEQFIKVHLQHELRSIVIITSMFNDITIAIYVYTSIWVNNVTDVLVDVETVQSSYWIDISM